MSQDPTVPHARQWSHGNHGSTVQIGGNNSAPINILRRPKLPTSPVPTSDVVAASDPLWAHSPTPQRAAETLSEHGLAVVAGERGSGRRISAVRALHAHASVTPQSPKLIDLAADWDDDETPDRETLPDPVSGHGYLIEATSRPLPAAVARALTVWAEELRDVGSCAVVTCDQNGWQGDTRFEVRAVRPDAVQVARNHLVERLASPAQAQWLQPEPGRGAVRGLLRGSASPDPTAGALADLITRSVSPSDAVAIAERLRSIKPDRLARAIGQRDNASDSGAQLQGLRELKGIREEVLLWENFLESTLADNGTRGQDRVMLLAAAYLENAPLELCIRAAAEFGPGDEPTARRRYREGRSPRRRMGHVGVDVTPDDRASFESRPGLAASAIRMDWHHWAHERDETRAWIDRITAPGGVAEGWTLQVGKRLLGLSRTAVDPPFWPILDKWTSGSASAGADRIHTVAHLLTEAAQDDQLARDAHKKLLDWAKNVNAQQREVVAHVCSGSYGRRWPHRALVRLRHILDRDDAATEVAASALVAYAARTTDGLTRVVDTIESWLDRYETSPAGPRAFLALIEPASDNRVLANLIDIARTTPRILDFLIGGWSATLQQPDVREQAHRVLLGWARAVHEGQVDRDFTFKILTDVRNAHTPVDAMSRFLYGSPEHEDPALVDARLTLANLRACNHFECSRSDCPLRKPPSAPTADSAAEGAGEPGQ